MNLKTFSIRLKAYIIKSKDLRILFIKILKAISLRQENTRIAILSLIHILQTCFQSSKGP